jgi:hypothetical protein
LIRPRGGKYWRYDYRFAGKRKTLALGIYPDVSLAQARKAHLVAREGLSEGIDPAEVKKINKLTKNLTGSSTFEGLAREWFNQKMGDKSDSYRVRTLRILEKDLFPSFGNQPISKITPLELAAVLKKIENRTIDIAHRAKQTAGLIFRYAIATGRAKTDPVQLGGLKMTE